MNSFAIDYLRKQGYKNINQDYYNYIENWELWYRNNEQTFHQYYDTYGKERQMYTLGMAKRVSEDWASLLYSERDEITTSRKSNNKYVKGFIDEINLETEIPKCIEMSAWSGTCGTVIRIKNAMLEKGVLTANENTQKSLIKVSAKQIVPLKVEHGKIIDVAIVSETMVGEIKALYIELHKLNVDGYEISNIYINATNGKPITVEGVLKSFKTGSNIPLFSLLMPPKVNIYDDNNGLGLSVYGDGIDQLKGCDMTYHNFMMDFFLGGKKVIYNKSLIKYKTSTRTVNGETVTVDVPQYPDDISKQQFMEINDNVAGINDKSLIHEYNPDLRVADNKDGIQFALDMLSFKVGFGTKYYQFENGGIVTATEYSGERQDLIQNAKKYRDNLSQFIEDIIKAGLLLGRLVFNQKVTEDCDVLIDNVDGFMEDEESIKKSAREDLAMGIISKLEYRMTVYHETEEVAQEQLDKLAAQNTITQITV